MAFNTFEIMTSRACAVVGTYEALAGADLTNFLSVIPPIATRVFGTIGAGTGSNSSSITVAANVNGLGATSCVAAASGGDIDSFFAAAGFDVPLETQNLFWKSGATGNRHRMTISGYRF